ncbi:hypothetical protein VQH23_04020 [Pararoseomonas sp. SCSIO 73927]|uniref:hypothetical protein n=1 Tax=Pararoseomonas sp. SCSIO 73927 TaxID=3114537 RepID=UPI0030D403A2
MTAALRPTRPTAVARVGQQFTPVKYGLSDPPDLSDRNSEGGAENSIRLSDLATRWRTELDHDAAEAAAMAEHYAGRLPLQAATAPPEDFSEVDAWIAGR